MMMRPFQKYLPWVLTGLQMTKGCKLYAENALERLNLFVEVMMARDNTTAQVLIARAASLSAAARNTIESIKIHYVSQLS